MRDRLRRDLLAGGRAVGAIARSGAPAACEALGYLGFDFLMLDAEHAPLSPEESEHLIRASELGGAAPIVRVRENSPSLVTLALDLGASGVHVPHVQSAEDAERAVKAARYGPAGTRGFATAHRAARYGFDTPVELVAKAADQLVVLHIEDQAGLDHLDEIAAVPGVDVLFAAPFDLSHALGVPAELKHPLVQDAIGRVVESAERHGIVAGTYCTDTDLVEKWSARGVRYLLIGSDMGFLVSAGRTALTAARAAGRPGG